MSNRRHPVTPILVVALLIIVLGVLFHGPDVSDNRSLTDDASEATPAAPSTGPTLVRRQSAVRTSAEPEGDSPPSKTCALTIRVLMPDDTPLVGFGTRVWAMHDGERTKTVLATGATDARGESRLGGLPCAQVFCEVGFARGTADAVVNLLPDQPNTEVLRSPESGTWITGRVLRSGLPVPKRDVACSGRDASGTGVWFRMKTNAEGRYGGIVPQGKYRLEVAGAPCDVKVGRWNYEWWQRGGSGPLALVEPIVVHADQTKLERDLHVPTRSSLVSSADAIRRFRSARHASWWIGAAAAVLENPRPRQPATRVGSSFTIYRSPRSPPTRRAWATPTRSPRRSRSRHLHRGANSCSN